MISLITIPNLAKMSTGNLLKCVAICITMDFVILLACINL
jgi:hypothetical protein